MGPPRVHGLSGTDPAGRGRGEASTAAMGPLTTLQQVLPALDKARQDSTYSSLHSSITPSPNPSPPACLRCPIPCPIAPSPPPLPSPQLHSPSPASSPPSWSHQPLPSSISPSLAPLPPSPAPSPPPLLDCSLPTSIAPSPAPSFSPLLQHPLPTSIAPSLAPTRAVPIAGAKGGSPKPCHPGRTHPWLGERGIAAASLSPEAAAWDFFSTRGPSCSPSPSPR